MPDAFPRPDVSDHDKSRLVGIAISVIDAPRERQVAVITALLLENHRLTQEVNQHRQRLGYEPLTIYP